MPRKVREPFAYSFEQDGSLGIAAYPVCSRSVPRNFHHVGYVRPANGAFLSSQTFDDIDDYGSWDRHASLDDAVDFILSVSIAGLEAHISTVGGASDGSENAVHLRSLRRSASLAREYSVKTAEAMARASRLRLRDAVANMLRASTYDEVMKTVFEVLADHVMGA